MTPCGDYSFCSEDDFGVASCSCQNGYENDPSDDDGIDENLCRRFNPCNSVTCSTQNSVCALIKETPQCVCSNNFSPFLLTDGIYVKATFLSFDSNATNMACAPTKPCDSNICNLAENKGKV